MLEFIKKFFAKEEVQEAAIELSGLNKWLDVQVKPLYDKLDVKINEIIEKINNEREKVNENLKKLESTKLQNPNIPERVKTIMEGNRAAFVKKISFFFNNLDLKFDNYNDLIEKCKNIENEIELLGKATAKSYQVLGEFFAREAGNIAINIKNVEKHSKDLVNSIKNYKISNIKKIKSDIVNIQQKIRLKQDVKNNLDIEKNNYENSKSKKSEIENKIKGIKSSYDYRNYEKLLEEKEKINAKLNKIENKLFHDFSAIEKALKKYAKIAFENENLILEYLTNPIIALIKDNEFGILKIFDGLTSAIANNEFDLDQKKKEKTLSKIDELDHVYIAKFKQDFGAAKKRSNDITFGIENNNSKKSLILLENELKNINENIENINNKVLNFKNELEKINIEKLKENLQQEVNDVINVRITIH